MIPKVCYVNATPTGIILKNEYIYNYWVGFVGTKIDQPYFSKKPLEIDDLPPGGVGLCSNYAPDQSYNGEIFISGFNELDEPSLFCAMFDPQVIMEKLDKKHVKLILSKGVWKSLLMRKQRNMTSAAYRCESIIVLPKFKYFKRFLKARKEFAQTVERIAREEIIKDVVV